MTMGAAAGVIGLSAWLLKRNQVDATQQLKDQLIQDAKKDLDPLKTPIVHGLDELSPALISIGSVLFWGSVGIWVGRASCRR